MSECTGEKVECEGIDYLGEGLFCCGYYDSSRENGDRCTLEGENESIRKKDKQSCKQM